jgi:hypothetical protein
MMQQVKDLVKNVGGLENLIYNLEGVYNDLTKNDASLKDDFEAKEVSKLINKYQKELDDLLSKNVATCAADEHKILESELGEAFRIGSGNLQLIYQPQLDITIIAAYNRLEDDNGLIKLIDYYAGEPSIAETLQFLEATGKIKEL